MASWTKILNHVKVSEGGHSADPDDSALKYGHSGIKGGNYDKRYPNNYIHTNRGVIWATYVAYKKKKGQTPNAMEFINMSDSMWKDIFKTLYWDKILGDKIKSQGIAEILVEAAWGGGLSSMVRTLQSWLNSKGANLNVDGAIGNYTINALNNIVNTQQRESSLIDVLTNQRLSYLRTLSSWKKYATGWTNRVLAVRDRAIAAITSTGGKITGLLVFAAISYYVYKKYRG